MWAHDGVTRAALGAYGLDIVGLPEAEEWMHSLPDSCPCLRVEKTCEGGTSSHGSRLDDAEADLRLIGCGRLRMRRGHGRALFSFREVPRDEDLLHPYLAPAAALAHLWSGNEALHAGAFATSAGAVALLAEKDGGKSTTLAWLADEHRLPVLSDDLVVVERGSILSGPRCLDLRRAGAGQLLNVDAAHRVRNAERLRITLPGAPAKAPLTATVVLRWGRRTRLDATRPADRPRELLPHRMYGPRLTGDPLAILELSALPMLILSRPRTSAGLRDAAIALTDYFA